MTSFVSCTYFSNPSKSSIPVSYTHLEVFTDISIPLEYYLDMLKKQSVVNSGITFHLNWETENGFEEYDFVYKNGIIDYVTELAEGTSLTAPVSLSLIHIYKGEKRGFIILCSLVKNVIFDLESKSYFFRIAFCR